MKKKSSKLSKSLRRGHKYDGWPIFDAILFLVPHCRDSCLLLTSYMMLKVLIACVSSSKMRENLIMIEEIMATLKHKKYSIDLLLK